MYSQLSDCLLYTSYYGAMFSLAVKYKLPLSGMKVCIPEVEDYHNEFSIISTTRSFTLRAKYVLFRKIDLNKKIKNCDLVERNF